MWPLGPGSVVLTDQRLLEEVTVTHPLPQHFIAQEFLTPITGEGVFAVSNGSLWNKMHKAILPAFSWTNIRLATGIIVEETTLFQSHLERHAADGTVFSMEELGTNLIYDMFGKILFNTGLKAQTQGSQDLEYIRGLIRLGSEKVHTAYNFNVVKLVFGWLKSRRLRANLTRSILSKVEERVDVLTRVDYSGKERHESILDMIIRGYTNSPKGKIDVGNLSQSDKQLMVTK